MAKLYAEITSDKGGRVIGKGGDKYVQIRLKTKNNDYYIVTWHGNYLRVSNHDGTEEVFNSLS